MPDNPDIDPALESGYNNMTRIPDAAQRLQALAERSARFRDHCTDYGEYRYGPGERQMIDLFRCGKTDAALMVYLHGGYWQRGDKSIYSYIAEPFNQRGVDVAFVGYPLCPQVSLADICDSTRQALAWLWHRAAELGICRERFNLSGHSAGGHLTAMGLCTDWRQYDEALPSDLIQSAVAYSGLYRLEPLRHTSIGVALALDSAEAERLSPVELSPQCPAPLLACVGGAESEAFFGQTDDLIEAWSASDLPLRRHVDADANHIEIVVNLANPESGMFSLVLDWLR